MSLEDGEDEDIEVPEPSSTGFFKKKTDFHSDKISQAYDNYIKASCAEFVKGHHEKATDESGKSVIVHHGDTREPMFNSVETINDLMINDLQNTIYITKIEELMNSVDKAYEDIVKEQTMWWNNLTNGDKLNFRNNPANANWYLGITQGKLDNDSQYFEDYIRKKLKIYRQIFRQLELCLASKKYFQRQAATNMPSGNNGPK